MAAGTIGTTPRRRRLPADLALFEIANDALRGVETIGAAAREHDRVDAVHHVQRIEQVGLARAGCAAALRHAAHCAVAVDEDDRAAGRPFGQREVPDLEPGDRGQALAAALTRALPGVEGDLCRNCGERPRAWRRSTASVAHGHHARPVKAALTASAIICAGTQSTLSMSRVVPTQSAPAATTGPVMCSTGCKSIRVDELQVLEPEPLVGRNHASAAARFRPLRARHASLDRVLHALQSAGTGAGASCRSPASRCWLRELIARPSASRTVGTPTMVTGTLKSATSPPDRSPAAARPSRRSTPRRAGRSRTASARRSRRR